MSTTQFAYPHIAKVNEKSFDNLRAMVLAPMAPPNKYSEYSIAQVNSAFDNATDLIFATTYPVEQFPLPLAVILMRRNSITLMFTLPSGMGNRLSMLIVEEAVKFLRPQYNTLFIKTYGFTWLRASAEFNKFLKHDDDVFKTYILKFNQSPPILHTPVSSLIDVGSDFKAEPLIENANYEYAQNNGGPLLKDLLNQDILTEDELQRARFDVRGALLRPGQSQNPLGLHCDFFKPIEQPDANVSEDEVKPHEPLKIIFVSNGCNKTLFYTKPVVTHYPETSDWYKIIKQPEIASAVAGPCMSPAPGQPIQFSDSHIHEAKALLKSEIPDGASAIYRLMFRIVVYPESRISEVPKGGCEGVSQVYMMSEQEM